MKCLESEKYFFGAEILSFWLHRVAYNGVPILPKKGTNKLKVCEEEIQILRN